MHWLRLFPNCEMNCLFYRQHFGVLPVILPIVENTVFWKSSTTNTGARIFCVYHIYFASCSLLQVTGRTMRKLKFYSILICIAISSVFISSFFYVWPYHSANQSTVKRLPDERNQRNRSEQSEWLKPLFADLTSTASLIQKTHMESQQNGSRMANSLDSLVQTKASAQMDARATESKSRTPVIPLIFHQIYRDTSLPAPYGICLYSLLRNHRFRDGRRERKAGEFDYYFWTDQSIKEYREDGVQHKEFAIFNSARETIEVSDMLRYFFLYEFGGIYLDLDMEPVNPFLPLLERGFPCILSEENPIQVSYFVHRKKIHTYN